MRITVLPFAIIAIVAGCSSGAREQGTKPVARRDLTLATRTGELQIASSVETEQPRIHRKATRRPKVRLAAALPAPAALSTPAAAPAAPEPVTQPAQPVAQPSEAAATPLNDRELLPGKTITIIPASTGPSPGADHAGDLPPVHDRPIVRAGGGTCRGRGRGPGIGIAGIPRPDFR